MIRCTTCVATAHAGDDGALPLGWGLTDAGAHVCPIHPSGDPAIYTSPGPKWMPVPFADVALRMPRGPVSHVRGRLRVSSASPCPDCGEPVVPGLGCFCRPGERG